MKSLEDAAIMPKEHRAVKSAIQTFRGNYVDIKDPCVEDIDELWIAHALSNLCRFTGHCARFYSVAQHSVLVSRIVPPQFALQGLMHDAAEAVVGDMSSPLKSMLPEFQVYEARAHAAIMERFCLPVELPLEVKHADLVALATERRDLMPHSDIKWGILDGVEPLPGRILTLYPPLAEGLFLRRFDELMAQKHGSDRRAK